MAYDFFPTKGKEILTQCKKFPASNVAEVIKLHEVLQKKYKIDAPINMDLGSKFQTMKKTKVNVFVADDPLRAVVRGTGIVLKNIPKYKSVLIK